MLKEYQRRFIKENLQFILLNQQGIVAESDQNIFRVALGKSIMGVHPFFESFPAVRDSPEREFKFFCIHISVDEDSFIVDIDLNVEKHGFILIIHDLTKHYEAYQSVAQTRNESVIKTELTVIKNKELEERERFKNRFIQNFSHEIRNPLTSIMAITDILADTSLTDEQGKMLDFLKESNTNLRLMLEDVLSIGAIETGRLDLQEKPFSLPKLFKLLEFTYRTKAKRKGIRFVANLDEKIPEFVEGDRLRLYQILTNLLDNALKYTEEGDVALSVLFNQKWANKVSIRFQVSDTGVGIPEHSRESIFESFSQLNKERNSNGSGLGLAIVKGLLNLMGSEIKVTSQENEGAVFFFDLLLKYPLHPIDDDDLITPKRPGQRNHDAHPVLIVEDDERIQTVILKTLIDAKIYNVEIISDGAEVVKELVNNPYSLVLMDVDLPNITGDQLTILIRDFPFKNIKNIPIIGFTANAYKDQIETYLQIGMNKVITKPFHKEELLKAVFDILK